MTDDVHKLLALGISLVVALAASWWLTRHERRRAPRALVAGYPAREFPHREPLDPALAALCDSQASLLRLYHALPASAPARATLIVCLEELRALMDGAYPLASLQASPAARARLQSLVAGVQEAVQELTAATEPQVGDTSGQGVAGELEIRVEVMRALARDASDR